MKKTYHIITIGCQMNKSDSERIASYLEFYGFKNEELREKASLVIINTCGIRQTAEDRNYGLIPRIKKDNPKVRIILAGCLAGEKNLKRRLKDYVDIWLPIVELPFLYKKLGLNPSTSSLRLRSGRTGQERIKSNNYLCVSPKVNSSFSVFIPIGNGCNNFCSYCFVPFARGREIYRNAYEVIEEAEKFAKAGYKEIILIAQNVNSYHSLAKKKDLKYFKEKKIGDKIEFHELLKRVSEIEGDFWLRFLTSNPKDLSDQLIKAVATNDKICNHIHLPAQAGDDEILKKMNRRYTHAHYLGLISKIKKQIPDCSITTDIIVGFPKETKKQFGNTRKLFLETGFDMAYVSRFSPRPGTKAAEMDDNVTKEEKARREAELMKIIGKTSLKNSKKFIGKNILVLIEKKNRKGEWFGKNEQSKVIRIKNSGSLKNLEGKFILVKITEVEGLGLRGIMIRNS